MIALSQDEMDAAVSIVGGVEAVAEHSVFIGLRPSNQLESPLTTGAKRAGYSCEAHSSLVAQHSQKGFL